MLLTANPYIQKGQNIRLNCSSSIVPVGQTAEFLVNNMTITNIRKHKWICFNTKLNEACSNGTCSCADNRKSYVSVFKPDYKSDTLSFMCRMKFKGGVVTLSEAAVATVIGK